MMDGRPRGVAGTDGGGGGSGAGGGRTRIGETLLRHLELIGRLQPEEREAVRSLDGQVRQVARGTDLLSEGERPDESVIVLSGLLHRYKVNRQGRRQIYSLYLPGEAPCLETTPMEVMDNNLAATAPSVIGVIPHCELDRVMSAYPQVLRLIWRETLVQGAIFREWLMRNSLMLAHEQMAHFFCEIMLRARRHGAAEGDSCALPMTQEDLADALGVTPVHVNRTLQVLRAGRLVEFRSGRLTVPDWDALAEIAEFDPLYLHLRSGDED